MSSPETLPAATVAAAPTDETAAQRKRSRALFSTGVAGLVGFCVYYGATAKVEDPIHMYLGLGIAVLSALPALAWAKRARYTLPVFEVFLLTSLSAYAIPLLSGHEQLQRFDPETLTSAALLVLLYLIASNLTYVAVSARPKRTIAWRREIVSRDISKFLGYGMILATAYTIISQFTGWITNEYGNILRSVAFGVGNIACFVQSRRWGLGELPHQEKVSFGLLLFAQVFFGSASLLLVNGLSLLLLSLLGYISGARRIPFLPVLVGLAITGVLHNGKSAMRDKYWGPHGMNRNDVKISDLPEFYSNWFTFGFQPPTEDPTKSKNAKLFERASLFHIMCQVVAITPERQPYLNGETYTYVFAQFVPRPFWPDKPSAHIATNRLAVYYGLQSTEDTSKTTVGFGLVTEAYANFGFFGVAVLGIVFATAFKKITVWSSESPILSYPGLFMIVLMAWSFMTEYTLSIWLSSMWTAVVVVLGVPFFTRNFFQ